MKPQFHSFLRKFKTISSLAFNIVQFFTSLLAIITTSAGAAFLAWLLHFQGWAVPIFTFLLGVFVEFVLVIIFLLKASPPRWVLKGYKYVKTDCLYIIHSDDPGHHTYIIETEIEAIKSGVNVFENTYRWTGHGKEEKPKVVSHGHTLMGKIIKQNGLKYLYVHLGQELKAGARTTIKVIIELYDVDNEFEPFLAKNISVPMDYMALRVILPKIRWDITSPVFRHRYSIDWTY